MRNNHSTSDCWPFDYYWYLTIAEDMEEWSQKNENSSRLDQTQPNFVYIIGRPGGVGSDGEVPGVGERVVGVEGRWSRGRESLASKTAAEGPKRDAPRLGLGVVIVSNSYV